jgi:RNA polymerase sigma-70 factor (ECF subfamily)
LDRPDDVGGWLYRVAANLAVSRLRRERLFSSRILRGWRAEQDEVLWPDDAVLAPGKLATEALSMLRRLPSRERVVVCMKLLDDKPQKEIAAILSLSEGYVSKLYQRACRRLAAAGWEAPHDEA